MAPSLSASTFLSHLKTFGIRYEEHGDWRTHNRNHKGAWGPVNGVMLHHTVTSGLKPSLGIVTDGYSGLPGPLCHGLIDKTGVVHLIGWGRTNHAGLGDDDVLAAVIAERASLPPANEANTDGNARFYGFECINLGDGKDPWPEEQVDAMCRASAALCKAHGWNERSVIGHLEWQPGKVDPRGLSMSSLRTRIGGYLKNPPKGGGGSTKPVVDLSELIKAAKANPKAPGTPVTYKGVKTVEDALVAEGLLAKSLADGHFGTATVTAYQKWQLKLYPGASTKPGGAADGIPGMDSLKKLGAKHGFTVTA